MGRLARRDRLGLPVSAEDGACTAARNGAMAAIALAPRFTTPIVAPIPAAMQRLLTLIG